MAEYNFRKDITVGERGEKVLIKELENKGLTFVSDNKDNKFDLLMKLPTGNDITFEVKTDVWCVPGRYMEMPFGKIWVEAKDSGNLFIEFECRGKSSGVTVSTANTFLYYFPYYGEYWAIQMSTLRKLISNNNFRTTQQSGDDGSYTKGYLIPREKFKSYFKIYKTDYEWEK